MAPQPDELLETLSGEVGEMLTEVVQSAYKLAIDCFKRAKPYSDANTFGTDLYRFAGRMLSETAEDRPDLIEVVQEHPNFIHRVGRYDVYCHRVAKRKGADIWRSFPNPETESVERSTTLFLPGLEPDLSKLTTVVLAHIGNEEVGLCGTYLCLPVNAGEGIAWGYVHELYVAQQEPVVSPTPPPAAEPEDVATPIVRRRARRKGDR
jgi:hypothetical protein